MTEKTPLLLPVQEGAAGSRIAGGKPESSSNFENQAYGASVSISVNSTNLVLDQGSNASVSLTAANSVPEESHCGQCDLPPDGHSAALLRDHTYLDKVEEGSHQLRKGCVQIVGGYKVGKTSTLRSLMGKPSVKVHKTTWGFDVIDVSCEQNRSQGDMLWRSGRPTFRQLFYKLLPQRVRRLQNFLIKCFVFLCDPLRLWCCHGLHERGVDQYEGNTNSCKDTVAHQVEEMLNSSQRTCTNLPNPYLHFTCFDFAGQWEYFMMHQMFLNCHAVYLLVIAGDKALDCDPMPDTTRENVASRQVPSFIPQTQLASIDFWLKAIYSRIVERIDGSKVRPKVILVVTKADLLRKHHGGRNDGVNEYKAQLLTHVKQNPCEYHNLVYGDPIFVDNMNCTKDEGVKMLRTVLHTLFSQSQASVDTKYPSRYALVLELIRQGRFMDGCYKMSFSDFAKESRLILKTQKDARDFLTFHHACGDLLFFRLGEEELVITRPQQLMAKIRPLFVPKKLEQLGIETTSVSHIDKRGVLSKETLAQICGDDSKIRDLLMMFDFVVSWDIAKDGQQQYLVPSLLEPVSDSSRWSGPHVAPAIGFTFYTEETKENPYVPFGLFPRLVACCMHRSNWVRTGNMFYNLANFKVLNRSNCRVDLVIRLQLTEDSVKLMACKVGNYSSTEDSSTDDVNAILTKARKDVHAHLKNMTKEVFPGLKSELKMVVWCKEPVSSKDLNTKPLVEMPEELVDFLYCDNHSDQPEHNFLTDEYRPWFVGAEDPRESDESFLPIEVKADPSPQQTLQKFDGKVYKLIHENRGLVVIVNNFIFKPTASGENLEERHGSLFDENNLRELFSKLGFSVTVFQNVGVKELRDGLESLAKRTDHGDAFFLWILSHGSENVLYCSDGVAVARNEIKQYFNGERFASLRNKPKVLFFVCCQGKGKGETTVQEFGDCHLSDYTEHIGGVHPAADTLIVNSTIGGYMSYRNKESGTWFVRIFVQQMCRSAHKKHLEEILHDVNEQLQCHCQLGKTQQASWEIQVFNKKLYFLPGYIECG